LDDPYTAYADDVRWIFGGITVDLAPYVAVVVPDILGAAQTPERRSQHQRVMCDLRLFDGQPDFKEWLSLVSPQGGKPLSKPSRACEEIDYWNWHFLFAIGC